MAIEISESGHTDQRPPRLEADLARAAHRLLEVGRNLVPTDHGRRNSFFLLGYGAPTINASLAAYEPRVRRSFDSMRLHQTFREATAVYSLNRQSDRRRLRMWSATPEARLASSPLIALQEHHVRAAPVLCQTMLFDDSCVIIPGAPDWAGESCAWATTDQETVAVARQLVALTKRAATRPRSTLAAAVSARQLLVARLVLVGAKNATMARRIGVSERTIGTDVAALAKALSVSGRGELVAVLGGPLGPEHTIDELM